MGVRQPLRRRRGRAVEIVQRDRKASTSHLQRRATTAPRR